MSFADIDFGSVTAVLVTGAACVLLLRLAADHARRHTVERTRRILREVGRRSGPRA